MKNNLLILLAQKANREGVARIGLKTVAADTKLSYYTLRAMANETIAEYPKEVLATLCEYLNCTPGDLLSLVSTPDQN